MIVLTKTIVYKPGETVQIKPIFDVHYGSTNCDVRKFKAFLKDSDKNTYFIGGGDLIESIPVTDPRYRKSNERTCYYWRQPILLISMYACIKSKAPLSGCT